MNQAAGRPCGDKCIDHGRCDKTTSGCVLGRGQTITLSGKLSTYQVWAPTLEFCVLREEGAGDRLQQRWMEQGGGGIEWRDVPVVAVKA
jgi:hypothetical protein